MKQNQNYLFLCILLFMQTFAFAYICPETCVAPTCQCASPETPGGLAAANAPQFVLITFDDALHPTALDLTEKISEQNHKNPNGAPLPFTYYISTDYSDYHVVQRRHAQGHEIGVHTMTHSTSVSSSYDKWRSEIIGSRQALSELAQIPIDEIVGFRAPLLQHSDHSMNILYDQGFLYESSITEQIGHLSTDGGNFIWPYTFDYLGAQACPVGECPKQAYPGLWEVPMWGFHDEFGRIVANMDPPGNYQSLTDMFKLNFDKRYDGNKAPMGVFLHPGWLSSQDHIDAINDFIEYAYTKENVWFVTNRQLIEWMRNPVPASQMNAWSWVQYSEPQGTEEVADGWDNDNDGSIDEDTKRNCSYSFSNFETNVNNCPSVYPAPVVVPTYLIEASVVAAASGPVTCSEAAWDPTHSYTGRETVSYQGSVYYAKWWAGTALPTSGNAWRNDGVCVAAIENRGSLSPVGTVHVEAGTNKTFTFTPNPDSRVNAVAIDGNAVAASASYTFQNVTANHTLEVNFAEDDNTIRHQISVVAGNGGVTSPSSNLEVVEGQNQSFTFTANAGYVLTSVLVDGVNLGAIANYQFQNVVTGHTVETVFEEIVIPTFVITASAEAGGIITPNGITNVEQGSNQTYQIQASTGYAIESVIVDGINEGVVPTWIFNNVQETHTVSVTFEEVPLQDFTITASSSVGGTITPSGAQVVQETTSKSFALSANSGFQLDSILVDGVNQGAIMDWVFSSISANHTIEAFYSEVPAGGLCDNVEAWSSSTSWTSYSVGDKRTDANKLWEVSSVAYSIYQPSGQWGYFGWTEIGVCP